MSKVSIPELAERLSERCNIGRKEALLIVKGTRDFFVDNINARNPIEIRGFGSVRYSKIAPHKVRNPTTGETFTTTTQYRPHFKPAKQTVEIIEE
jgi:nucleoid DNA-binding protein